MKIPGKELLSSALFRETPSFFRYPGGEETAVLIHGWGVRAAAMGPLARYLNAAGFTVLNYDYPTSKAHIAEHGKRFLEFFRGERFPGRIFFLTHSMGGLVLRYALAGMTEAECRSIAAVVMLGPPNKGSRLAVPGLFRGAAKINASLGDMAPGAKALEIPPPSFLPPVGIIAGNFDGKVKPADTALPGGLPFEFCRIDCTHPGLRRPANTGTLILNFFRNRKFAP